MDAVAGEEEGEVEDEAVGEGSNVRVEDALQGLCDKFERIFWRTIEKHGVINMA